MSFKLDEPRQISDNTLIPSERGPSRIRTYHLAFVMKLTIMSAIGGFLFGYDTGIISGANLYFYVDFPQITSSQKENIVSLAVIGAAVGSILIGPFSDNFGRKLTMILADLFFTAGAALMLFAGGIPQLMAGRFIAGLGIGAASMVVPVYLAETSPTSIRGRIVTFNVIFITSGQLIAYLIALACGSNWRLMLGLSGVPSLFQLFLMLFFPESPRWLMKMKRDDEARLVLNKIFDISKPEGREELDNEFENIKETLALEDVDSTQYQKYKELFTVYRKIVFIGVMLQIWQQLSGINTAMYYGTEMMKQAGFGSEGDEKSTLIASIPLAAINCVGTFVAIAFVDNMGRRYIMLRTLPGCGLFMAGMGVGIWLLKTGTNAGQWISALSLFIYIAFFSIGMGATPWTVNSEIYPLHLRGIGNSMSTFGNWISNYVICAVFLSATESTIGQILSYFVLGGFCMCAWLFIYKLLPETKGKTIEEIIQMFIPDLKKSIHSFHESENLMKTHDYN